MKNSNFDFEVIEPPMSQPDYKKPARYVPGPNDPMLPPQLNEFKDKTTDDVLAELNKMPFFMTQLDDSGENAGIEALKALAYEGEPHEIAGNFKNQGNDSYKEKDFKGARSLYTKGIDVKCNDDKINEALYANRAMCELELKNYRLCINDCKNALSLNPKNLKCYYRMSKAFFLLDKLDESLETIDFGLKIDSSNISLQNLLQSVVKKQEEIKAREIARLEKERRIALQKEILTDALKERNVSSIKTSQPAELLKESKLKLEDPLDLESQMIYPAIVMYPTIDEFDFVAEVSELTEVQELISLVMQKSETWYDLPNHSGFANQRLNAFMETQSGGLVKVGNNLNFHEILRKESPRVTLFDDAIKLYIVPKSEAKSWITKWDREVMLEKRVA